MTHPTNEAAERLRHGDPNDPFGDRISIVQDPPEACRCGHRPHEPGQCKARYHVTFEPGEPGEPCLCGAAPEPRTDRRDAAIGYALLETEHLPGFARRGPAFREKLAQAGYRIERQAAEAAPSPDLIDRVERLLSFYERFVPHAVQSEYREVREDVIDAIAAVRLAAPSLLQERDRLYSQRLVEAMALFDVADQIAVKYVATSTATEESTE